MRKTLLLIPALALLFSCHKNNNTACGVQVCNDIFKQINVVFVDKTGKAIIVSNYSVTNQRTNLLMQPKYDFTKPVAASTLYLVADDSMRDQLSTDGDNVQVNGTNSATGQTKSTLFKISGGCNCHVAKIAGPDTIKFDQ